MNQFNWIFIDGNGKRQSIGLLHGAKSGHLVIHCNSKVILVDFKVLQTKSYNLFINEEFCIITIERKNGNFLYSLDIDKEVDTPLNRVRKKIDKKHLYQTMMFAAALIILILGFSFGISIHNYQKKMSPLYSMDKEGQETYGKIFQIPKGSSKLVSYFFVVDGETISSKKSQPYAVKNNMPLKKGDEFMVKYNPTAPNYNRIDYLRPTLQQVQVYKKRVAERYLNLFPQTTVDYCNCLIESVYEYKAYAGLCDFYFLDIDPLDNKDHNKLSYNSLIDDLGFQELLKKRCSKLK